MEGQQTDTARKFVRKSELELSKSTMKNAG
jgi:hypothetical protein